MSETIRVYASKDSYISSQDDNSNFGSFHFLLTGREGTVNNLETLMYFDVSQAVTGLNYRAVLLSVKIGLYLDDADTAGYGKSHTFYALDTQGSFTEEGVTWISRDGVRDWLMPGLQPDVEYYLDILSRIDAPTEPGWAEFEFTPYAKWAYFEDWLGTGNSNVGVILLQDSPEDESKCQWRSSEYPDSEFVPYLEIEYELGISRYEQIQVTEFPFVLKEGDAKLTDTVVVTEEVGTIIDPLYMVSDTISISEGVAAYVEPVFIPPIPEPLCEVAPVEPYSISPQYMVRLKDHSGNIIAVFDDWLGLSYYKVINGVGNYSFTIQEDDYRVNLFETDTMLEVWRAVRGVNLDWYLEFEGFHRQKMLTSPEDGRGTFTSVGVSYNDLLARTCIAYKQGTIRADKNNLAGIVMKEYVYENCGAGATNTVVGRLNTGVLPGFTVEATAGTGPNWSGSMAYENLLDALVDIAESTGVDFNVYGNGPAQFQFNTYTGQLGIDRTTTGVDPATGLNSAGNTPFVFNIIAGNTTNMEYVYDALGEVNVAIILGSGDMSTRQTVTVKDVTAIAASPWNRREVTRGGGGNTEFEYQLIQAGEDLLKQMSVKEGFSFSPLQSFTSLYGKNYQVGDRVTVKHKGISRNFRIVSSNVGVENRSEAITLQLANIRTRNYD